MTDRGASERISGGRRRGLEHALRDLIPTTLAAGAAAVAVAVAVGGSTSVLPAPFASGLPGADRVTSAPAPPRPASGRVSVRLGSKAGRPVTPAGLGQHLVAASFGVAERPVADAVASVLLGPIFLSGATEVAEAAELPAGGPGVVSEVVSPVPADVPTVQAVVADAALEPAPPDVQEAHRLQRPRRLKTPRGGAEADAVVEPLVVRAASLSGSSVVAKASSADVAEPSDDPSNGNANGQGNANGPGNGNGNGNGNANGNGQGNPKHKPAGDA